MAGSAKAKPSLARSQFAICNFQFSIFNTFVQQVTRLWQDDIAN
jgi:hypothetical protein